LRILKPDGSDWSPAQWLQAVIGELGEYANIRKKYERGDLNAEEFARLAAKELADVQIYLDILALRCLDFDAPILHASGFPLKHRIAHATGIDLGQATMDKFNEVSIRVGSRVRLVEQRAGATQQKAKMRRDLAVPLLEGKV
jgi:hypothetical protein